MLNPYTTSSPSVQNGASLAWVRNALEGGAPAHDEVQGRAPELLAVFLDKQTQLLQAATLEAAGPNLQDMVSCSALLAAIAAACSERGLEQLVSAGPVQFQLCEAIFSQMPATRRALSQWQHEPSFQADVATLLQTLQKQALAAFGSYVSSMTAAVSATQNPELCVGAGLDLAARVFTLCKVGVETADFALINVAWKQLTALCTKASPVITAELRQRCTAEDSLVLRALAFLCDQIQQQASACRQLTAKVEQQPQAAANLKGALSKHMKIARFYMLNLRVLSADFAEFFGPAALRMSEAFLDIQSLAFDLQLQRSPLFADVAREVRTLLQPALLQTLVSFTGNATPAVSRGLLADLVKPSTSSSTCAGNAARLGLLLAILKHSSSVSVDTRCWLAEHGLDAMLQLQQLAYPVLLPGVAAKVADQQNQPQASQSSLPGGSLQSSVPRSEAEHTLSAERCVESAVALYAACGEADREAAVAVTKFRWHNVHHPHLMCAYTVSEFWVRCSTRWSGGLLQDLKGIVTVLRDMRSEPPSEQQQQQLRNGLHSAPMVDDNHTNGDSSSGNASSIGDALLTKSQQTLLDVLAPLLSFGTRHLPACQKLLLAILGLSGAGADVALPLAQQAWLLPRLPISLLDKSVQGHLCEAAVGPWLRELQAAAAEKNPCGWQCARLGFLLDRLRGVLGADSTAALAANPAEGQVLRDAVARVLGPVLLGLLRSTVQINPANRQQRRPVLLACIRLCRGLSVLWCLPSSQLLELLTELDALYVADAWCRLDITTLLGELGHLNEIEPEYLERVFLLLQTLFRRALSSGTSGSGASSNGASSSSSTWGVLMSHSLQMFHRFSSLSNVQLFTERLDMLIPEASFPEVMGYLELLPVKPLEAQVWLQLSTTEQRGLVKSADAQLADRRRRALWLTERRVRARMSKGQAVMQMATKSVTELLEVLATYRQTGTGAGPGGAQATITISCADCARCEGDREDDWALVHRGLTQLTNGDGIAADSAVRVTLRCQRCKQEGEWQPAPSREFE